MQSQTAPASIGPSESEEEALQSDSRFVEIPYPATWLGRVDFRWGELVVVISCFPYVLPIRKSQEVRAGRFTCRGFVVHEKRTDGQFGDALFDSGVSMSYFSSMHLPDTP